MSYVPIRPDASSSKNSNQPLPENLSGAITGRQARGKKNSKSKSSTEESSSSYPIIVHCHLCWDWVWQRPQQFISRLSKRHRILFVETIGPDPNLITPVVRVMEKTPELPNITRLRLQFPAWRWGDAAYVDRMRRELVEEALRGPLAGQFENPVQWFYDPMSVSSFAGHMGEIATVYDCMDELSKFAYAPPELTRREAELLARAEVVFTGGRKLYEVKREHNPNCHFYGCGVDIEHFGRALDAETVIPHDLKAFNRPVLGFFGVVDERMDYELIAKLADANPKWSLAIIGPVMKVEQHQLPRRPNIHWLGSRDYAQLPAYCKGFDLCLMPFALNAATEYINPTKALEYMATGRMIVSSAVSDVVSNFSSVVKVASSHDDFVDLCKEAIERPDPSLVKRGLEMAAENTWESIVEKLEKHVEDALAAKQGRKHSRNHSGTGTYNPARSERAKAGVTNGTL
jgi:glycosyltransferase involved in cell wall biosynthesis